MPKPDKIIQQVLQCFDQKKEGEKSGATRAVLVLDKNTKILEPSLEEANFSVVVAKNNLSNFEDKKRLLGHRILITLSSNKYILDAPVLDYGVIGLDALDTIDSAQTYPENKTAKLISKVIVEHNLVTLHSAFIIVLHPKGKHRFVHIN